MLTISTAQTTYKNYQNLSLVGVEPNGEGTFSYVGVDFFIYKSHEISAKYIYKKSRKGI